MLESIRRTMSLFFKLVICLSFLLSTNYLAEAKHQKKLPSAVVTGTVYCDTCFHQDFHKANNFITGATVEIQCNETGSGGGFKQQVKTNNHGEFKFDLPISVSKHAKKIRGCSIKLISSNEPLCDVVASATSSSLRLKSIKEGKHIFSAGFFSFKPLKQPEICNQKSNVVNKGLSPESNSKKQTDQLPFVPIPFIPPNPLLPPPSILPPNPLLPPPSLIPPVLPTPPPSIFPPFLPTPPSPPVFPLPQIPGLVPSPPPPAPTFPIPLPPFPFQPTPGLPGGPPAEVSSESRTTSP